MSTPETTPDEPTPDEPIPGEPPRTVDGFDDDEFVEGSAIINVSFAGTGALLVAAAAGAADPDGLGVLTAGVSLVAFTIGVAGFLWGYATGVVRSRDEKIGLGGLFFLSGTAPRIVRFRLRIAFAAQTVIAVSVAAFRPYTAVAFAVLAPMLGLGMMAVWGARHGTFFPKDDR